MKNQKKGETLVQGTNVQESKKIDSINLENAKVNFKNAKKDLQNRESRSVGSRKSIYRNLENLNSEDQKRFRQKIRNSLRRFVNAILGKDRSESDVEKSIREFLIFYKENWKIQDFKIENFSSSKNSADLKDYSELLEFVKSAIE